MKFRGQDKKHHDEGYHIFPMEDSDVNAELGIVITSNLKCRYCDVTWLDIHPGQHVQYTEKWFEEEK